MNTVKDTEKTDYYRYGLASRCRTNKPEQCNRNRVTRFPVPGSEPTTRRISKLLKSTALKWKCQLPLITKTNLTGSATKIKNCIRLLVQQYSKKTGVNSKVEVYIHGGEGQRKWTQLSAYHQSMCVAQRKRSTAFS